MVERSVKYLEAMVNRCNGTTLNLNDEERQKLDKHITLAINAFHTPSSPSYGSRHLSDLVVKLAADNPSLSWAMRQLILGKQKPNSSDILQKLKLKK